MRERKTITIHPVVLQRAARLMIEQGYDELSDFLADLIRHEWRQYLIRCAHNGAPYVEESTDAEKENSSSGDTSAGTHTPSAPPQPGAPSHASSPPASGGSASKKPAPARSTRRHSSR